MKFGHSMDVDDPKVDFKGQGHKSKVKVTRSKNVILHLTLQSHRYFTHVTGNVGGGSKVTLVKVIGHVDQGQPKGHDTGTWAHVNVKLHFFIL